MRGRRGTFGTSIDVSGGLATKGDIFDATAFCVAGVTLSAPQGGTFGTSIDVSGSLATKRDIFDAAAFCVAGVALSAPQARFAWQAWYFLCHHRCRRKLGDEVGLMWRRGLLRGRRGTFGTSGSICVAGVVLSVPP